MLQKSSILYEDKDKAFLAAPHAVVSCSGHRQASRDNFLLSSCLPPAPPQHLTILLQERQHFSHRAAAGTEHGEPQF